MTKADLISAIARAAKVNKKTAEDVMTATFETLGKTIKKNKRFEVPAFGTFTARSTTATKRTNPRTGGVIAIKPSRTVGFKPAPRLKKSL
jgi:DNA-binding protein HU-beta